jgi:hypothetical protein
MCHSVARKRSGEGSEDEKKKEKKPALRGPATESTKLISHAKHDRKRWRYA